MTPEKKRKLRNIALLVLLVLIGGTFAFTAFNQQAINDRERENQANVGGRVHDYFNREEENKDVFVENFGQEPIIVRLQLSEFMAIQERGKDWESVTPGKRENLHTWEPYIPEADNVSQRRSDSPTAILNDFSDLIFGWTRGGEPAPYYLPTFNMVYTSNHPLFDITAAAGDTRDLSYRLENGEVYPRATHPGDGTDGYWSEGETRPNDGRWPGATITRETAQNLYQDEAPMTLSQWAALESYEQLGNYWVIDEATGWAYYARALQGGEATSYLLDAAEMTSKADNILGSYYYGIHVTSELIGMPQIQTAMSLEQASFPRFSDEGEGFEGNLGLLLDLIRRGFDPNVDIPDDRLDEILPQLEPGQRFTTSGENFLYLGPPVGAEDSHDHMIIRNRTLIGPTWLQQPTAIADWYRDSLSDDFKARVQPVVIPSDNRGHAPEASHAVGYIGNWIPENIAGYPGAANDFTRINQSGIPQAFALSMADVIHFSANPEGATGTNKPFVTSQDRVAGYDEWWFTRTPIHWRPFPGQWEEAWGIENGNFSMPEFNLDTTGRFWAGPTTQPGTNGGVRPALIIRAGVNEN
ncbi:hypothetical protein LMK05_07675 [Lactococcus petauri]|nr:hypothetical protein LMK05_07675 [Lactococcus petauri]